MTDQQRYDQNGYASNGEFGFLALREGFRTVPRYLWSASCRTALIGKMHYYPIRARLGFDHMQMCEHLTN